MRARNIMGVVAGAFLVLSCAAHSILGWKALRGQLEAIHAPKELVLTSKVGWQFAGLAMLVFGLLALWTFAGRLRGRTIPGTPVLLAGVAYALYGVWALAVSGMNPFFLMFVVPGAMLAFAAGGGSGQSG